MLDDPSTLAVERYVNAFPGNKIEMLGRKGVFVKRQMGMGREGGGISSNTNVGRVTSSNAYNSDGGANYQYLWGQYLDYDAHQTQYNTNTTASTTTMTSGYEHVGQYSQVNAANATNYPQQPQAVTVQSSQGLSDYYALQKTYSQPQVQQHSQQQQQSLLEYVPAPQHLQYSSTPSSAIIPTQYNQHQYPNDSNHAASYQANYVVPQQSSTQFVVQQQTMQHNPALHAIPTPALYINQQQVPPPHRTTLEYIQNSQLPLSQMPQQSSPALLPPPPPAPSQQKHLNRWEQWQQPQLPPQPINHNPRSTQQPNYPLRGTGEVGGGGGKWNGGGMMGSYNRGMGGGDGGGGRGGGSGGGGAPISGGRNGREGRRNRPY